MIRPKQIQTRRSSNESLSAPVYRVRANKQVLNWRVHLKSGRTSPYFFNAGLFNTGRDLALLGRFYAEAPMDSGIDFDPLFGPAYKGIPIATTTAVALAEHHERDVPYCFNRKGG